MSILAPAVGNDETILVALCFCLYSFPMTRPLRKSAMNLRNDGGDPSMLEQMEYMRRQMAQMKDIRRENVEVRMENAEARRVDEALHA